MMDQTTLEKTPSTRFSYVRYDEESKNKQEALKEVFEKIEALVSTLAEGRAKSLVLTYLEIAYMWTGKAIRDEQIAREVQPSHVPERSIE